MFMVCDCWDITWFVFCCYACYALFLCIYVVFDLYCLCLYAFGFCCWPLGCWLSTLINKNWIELS